MSATASIEPAFKTLESFLSECRHNLAQSVSSEKVIEHYNKSLQLLTTISAMLGNKLQSERK